MRQNPENLIANSSSVTAASVTPVPSVVNGFDFSPVESQKQITRESQRHRETHDRFF